MVITVKYEADVICLMTSEDEEQPEGIVLSPRQVERQFTRIKKYLLQNFEELEDESYRGDIKPEIRTIFEKHIPIGEIMDEEMLQVMIASVVADLVKDVLDNVRGVDANIAMVFVMDFVNQCLEIIYSLEYSAQGPSDDFDPAYG